MAKGKLTFESAKCKGCSLCVSVCPKNVLELDRKSVNPKGYNPVFAKNPGDCIACAMCAMICPDSIIKVERDSE